MSALDASNSSRISPRSDSIANNLSLDTAISPSAADNPSINLLFSVSTVSQWLWRLRRQLLIHPIRFASKRDLPSHSPSRLRVWQIQFREIRWQRLIGAVLCSVHSRRLPVSIKFLRALSRCFGHFRILIKPPRATD